MTNLYSEYDSEQARQREQVQHQYTYPQGNYDLPVTGQTQQIQSNYGIGPQQLSPQAQDLSSRSNILALGLISFGIVTLIYQLFNNSIINIEGGMTLLSLASGFLFFAFWKRLYGLLIPGSILAGLAIGITFADLTNGISVLWGLAVGFFSIHMIGQTAFGKHGNWASIIAGILFLIGTIILITTLPMLFGGLGLLLPIILVGTGIWLGRNRLAHQ